VAEEAREALRDKFRDDESALEEAVAAMRHDYVEHSNDWYVGDPSDETECATAIPSTDVDAEDGDIDGEALEMLLAI